MVEPIVLEYVPSSMTNDGMNPPFGNSFSSTIPIIEDAETPTEMPIEIHNETTSETFAETCTKMKLT